MVLYNSPTKQAVHKIREVQPTNIGQFQDMFELNFLDSGNYRRAFHIVGTELVAKFEATETISNKYSPPEFTRHTKREVESINYMRTHYRHLLKYLPTIIYHAPGIVVMPRYKLGMLNYHKVKELRDVIQEGNAVYVGDLHNGNIMLDIRNNLRIIDTGCFLAPGAAFY